MTKNQTLASSTQRPMRVRVLDVGGSHVNAALVQIDGGTATIVRRAGVDIDAYGDADEVFRGVCAPAIELGREGDHDLWGIAIPGPFDYDTGIRPEVAAKKFASLGGLSVRDELAARLGADPRLLQFVNDADAYGLGEWAFGGSGRPSRLLCLTLGTGLGSAFVADGVPVHDGAGVPPLGQAYLLTHDQRPIEDFVSTRAIEAGFLEANGEHATVRDIAQRARDGHPSARRVIDSAMGVLGEVMAPWLRSFGAHQVVVGGSISRSWDLLEAPLREGIVRVEAELALAARLRGSTLLDDAPLLGAAEWVSRLVQSSS
jgi:glucokinase